MIQIVLIGIGAGAAAALLFASLASGSLLALPLFYLSPLPILIAGIGWNYTAGLIATLTATACLGVVLEAQFTIAFFIAVGAPAWWLGYLTLLARPGTSHEAVEWYPPGRIVVWAVMAGAAAMVLAIPYFGTDAQSFHANLRSGLEGAVKRGNDGSLDTLLKIDFDLMARVMPPAFASVLGIFLLLNTWLAARIASLSGQLRRPWPDLSSIQLPKATPFVLAAAIAGIFLPDLLGVIADIVAAVLMMAYTVLGFAVLHVITRGNNSRPLILAGVYATVIIFTWPSIIVALIGLIDTALDLRGRFARTRSPPTLH